MSCTFQRIQNKSMRFIVNMNVGNKINDEARNVSQSVMPPKKLT